MIQLLLLVCFGKVDGYSVCLELCTSIGNAMLLTNTVLRLAPPYLIFVYNWSFKTVVLVKPLPQ